LIAALAADAQVVVVTRAERGDAHLLLEMAELSPYISSVRSLDGCAGESAKLHVFTDVRARAGGAGAVSIVPYTYATVARATGYRCVFVGPARAFAAGDVEPDLQIAALDALHRTAILQLLQSTR
jgi:hypothetical protein